MGGKYMGGGGASLVLLTNGQGEEKIGGRPPCRPFQCRPPRKLRSEHGDTHECGWIGRRDGLRVDEMYSGVCVRACSLSATANSSTSHAPPTHTTRKPISLRLPFPPVFTRRRG